MRKFSTPNSGKRHVQATMNWSTPKKTLRHLNDKITKEEITAVQEDPTSGSSSDNSEGGRMLQPESTSNSSVDRVFGPEMPSHPVQIVERPPEVIEPPNSRAPEETPVMSQSPEVMRSSRTS
jgi:hypothetical protein